MQQCLSDTKQKIQCRKSSNSDGHNKLCHIHALEFSSIPSGTCLARGKNILTPILYLAYFGTDCDSKRLTTSSEFASRYSKDGTVEYWETLKDMKLLKIPYVQLGMLDNNDRKLGLHQVKQLLKLVNKESAPISLAKFGHSDIVRVIIANCIDSDCDEYNNDDDDDVKDRLTCTTYNDLRDAQIPNIKGNIDYILDKFICELATTCAKFDGWIRMSSFKSYSQADEVMLCQATNDKLIGLVDKCISC